MSTSNVIRLADYVAKFLADYGIRHIFMITGGGAMHLNDAIGRESRINYICNHHEQACAMAAEGYARVKEQLSVVCVTSGPGGTNTMTGVLGQWLDSIPVLYLSGQVRFDTTIASTNLPLRQLGDQEANIIAMVKPITKYSVMVSDPLQIRYHLEKAIYLATTGRPGPTWLDIPLNVQADMIDEENLIGFKPEAEQMIQPPDVSDSIMEELLKRLSMAQRPIILAGAGIRLVKSSNDFLKLIDLLGIPVQVAWDALDLVSSDHPLYAGRPSTLGQRGANFIFQNADFILSIGCRLNLRQIGYTFNSVARAAYKVVVDIDEAELKKPTIKPDLSIHADAANFIQKLSARLQNRNTFFQPEWLNWCKERLQKYPVVLPQYHDPLKPLNPYVFSETLSEYLTENDVVVSSNGASCVIPIQAMKNKPGMRHIVNSGCASMGYGLPSAIGACLAKNHGRVICLEGDGSIQLNIQEFQTIAHHRLPIKIFIYNNGGYLSIRTTQSNFFKGHLVGESENSGVGFPDFVKIAQAYGISGVRLEKSKDMQTVIPEILQSDGPVICDVRLDPNQLFMPRITSRQLPDGRMVSSPLEEMYPFLSEEEFLSNMIIPRWDYQS